MGDRVDHLTQEALVYQYSRSILALLLGLMLITAIGCTAQSDTAVAPPAIFPDQTGVLAPAAAWLVANHQNDDGGYSSFSGGANLADSDPGGTVDALLALAAARNPGIDAPLAYLRDHVDQLADFAAFSGGSGGKTLLALTAAGEDPFNFRGYDFVAILTGQLAATGQFNAETPFEQSLALLGLVAVNELPPEAAVAWLKAEQTGSGAWGDGFGTDENADATGMAIMALVASGEPANGEPLTRAASWLAASQLANAGWEYGPGYGSNASSTALILQALSALGEDFYSGGSSWAKDGQTPLSALLSYRSESGAFQVDFGSGPFDDFFTTVQAMPALTGRPYPIQQ
jgi:hypothetical protein